MRMRRPIGLRPPRNLLHELLVHDHYRRGAVDEIRGRKQTARQRACANRLQVSVARPHAMAPAAGLRRLRRRPARRAVGLGGRYSRGRVAPLRPQSHPAAAPPLRRSCRASPAINAAQCVPSGPCSSAALEHPSPYDRTLAPSSPRRSAAPPTARSRRPSVPRRCVPKPPTAKPRPACSELRRS